MASTRKCTVKGCERRVHTRDMCESHHYRRERGLDLAGNKRGPKPGKARRDLETCAAEGCSESFHCRSYCRVHYGRLKRGLAIDPPVVRRAPKGSGYKGPDGYRWLYRPGHPNASKQGRISEHVLVMSEHLGRPLADGESVHHRNGIRWDNRISNLELWASWQPSGQRAEDLVSYAVEVLRRYAPDLLVADSKELVG